MLSKRLKISYGESIEIKLEELNSHIIDFLNNEEISDLKKNILGQLQECLSYINQSFDIKRSVFKGMTDSKKENFHECVLNTLNKISLTDEDFLRFVCKQIAQFSYGRSLLSEVEPLQQLVLGISKLSRYCLEEVRGLELVIDATIGTQLKISSFLDDQISICKRDFLIGIHDCLARNPKGLESFSTSIFGIPRTIFDILKLVRDSDFDFLIFSCEKLNELDEPSDLEVKKNIGKYAREGLSNLFEARAAEVISRTNTSTPVRHLLFTLQQMIRDDFFCDEEDQNTLISGLEAVDRILNCADWESESDSNFFAYVIEQMNLIGKSDCELARLASKYQLAFQAGAIELVTLGLAFTCLCGGTVSSSSLVLGMMLLFAAYAEAYYFGQQLENTSTPDLLKRFNDRSQPNFQFYEQLNLDISGNTHERTTKWAGYCVRLFASSLQRKTSAVAAADNLSSGLKLKTT